MSYTYRTAIPIRTHLPVSDYPARQPKQLKQTNQPNQPNQPDRSPTILGSIYCFLGQRLPE